MCAKKASSGKASTGRASSPKNRDRSGSKVNDADKLKKSALAALIVVLIIFFFVLYLRNCTGGFFSKDHCGECGGEGRIALIETSGGDLTAVISDGDRQTGSVSGSDYAGTTATELHGEVQTIVTTTAVSGDFGGLFSSCQGLDLMNGDDEASSSSDIERQTVTWPVQPDDASYTAMMTEKYGEYSEMLTGLTDLNRTLSVCTDPNEVRSSTAYNDLCDKLTAWCDAAERYDTSTLQSEETRAVHEQLLGVAEYTRKYLALYPEAITAEGGSTAEADECLNELMTRVVALYEAMNTAPADNAPTDGE